MSAHKSSQQILALNAVRGLAAMLVVVSHLPGLAHLHFGPAEEGSLGVMVFFTLSGFLMGLLYLGKPAGWHEVSRYAVARFSRIAPPYLMVVVAAFLVYTLVDPQFPYDIGPHNLLRHLLFSGNVSVFWSIPPEVQFYALFIGLWWALQRARQGRTGALIGVVALAVAVLCVRDRVPGTFVVSKLHYFLMGALLGGLHPWWRRVALGTRVLTALQVVLLAVLGLFMLEVIRFPQNYWHDLGLALIAGLVVFAFSHDRTPIDALFAARPLQWLGDWSFSIYLVHVPLLYLMLKLGLLVPGALAWVSVALVVAGCAAFSVVIEHPACALTKRWLTALLGRLERGRRFAPTPARAEAAPALLVPDITPDRTPP
ncbi:MAG: acyltransferase [Rhizobacter sp.]|nr:acyltransferase [Rhizobacter sp.]